MNDAYVAIIPSFLEQRCEVYTTDNHLLFLGKITEYICEQDEIRLEDARGKELPWRQIEIGSVVRVLLYSQGNRSQVNIVEAKVTISMSAFITATITNILSKQEGRKNFRQGVQTDAFVSFVHEPMNAEECRVLDVSITGIGIACNTDYELNTKLLIADLQLRERGVKYSFECEIVRKLFLEDTGEFFYGCKFLNLTGRTEDRLMQDIFQLQANDLRGQK